jgi:hypothetical protein
MKKRHILAGILLFALLGIGLAGIAIANSAVDGDEPAMMVSPSVIVLDKVSTITVHTNIPRSLVDCDTIALTDNWIYYVAPTAVFADSLGHLVAKFAIVDLGLTRGLATLELSGDYKDGGCFRALDEVLVK